MNRRKKLFRFAVVLFLSASIFLGVVGVRRVTNFFQRAIGINANLVVDVSKTFPATDIWDNFAQGGEEPNRQLSSVVDKLRNLKPSYIRIDHVYDSYGVVSRDSSGKIIYDWTRLDLTIDEIISTGAKPFISLSYMPVVMAKDGDIVGLPVNWSDWENLVQATIEHYSGTGGKGIADVYYEVWNEPDLFGKFKIGGEKNYLDLYRHSVIGASRAGKVNKYKIGGPATTASYKNWIDKLAKYSLSNKLRLDFVSWHRYSKSLQDYTKDVEQVYSWVSPYWGELGGIQLIISELGLNSENDSLYDGNFGAMHAIAVSTVLQDKIDKAFTFEIKDGPGPEKYWGRWGILTHEKYGQPEAKPRYNAFIFLNKMKGLQLGVSGQGSWVKAFARKEDNKIRLLVVNYDEYGRHSELVPITFNGLENGNYSFKRLDFSGKVRESKVVIEGNPWSVQEVFNPNTASVFELIPIN